jgi:hypothetical protein
MSITLARCAVTQQDKYGDRIAVQPRGVREAHRVRSMGG